MTTQTNSTAIVVNVTATLVRCLRYSSVCLSTLAEPLSAGASAASSSANTLPRSTILAMRPVITLSSAAIPP